MITNAPADERLVRRSAAAGTIAPIWFWATLIVLALLHGTIDVSGHQLLRFGWLMYVGFFAYGSLTLFYVWGLRRRMPRRRRSSAAIVALTLWGCGPLLATFTMGPEQGPPQSWHAWLHLTGFLLVSLAPIVALPLFGSAVWGDTRWRPLGPVSVIWARRGRSCGVPADLADGGLCPVVRPGVDARHLPDRTVADRHLATAGPLGRAPVRGDSSRLGRRTMR